MNKIFFSVLVAVFLICGCSGGSSDSSSPIFPIGPDGTEPGGVDMSGRWEGTLSFGTKAPEPVNFVGFVQDGANLSGIHEWVVDGTARETEDVSGTVANSTVTISAIYRIPGSTELLEFAYDGTVDGDVYSGNIRFTGSVPNNPDIDISGTFTFTRVGGNPPPNPEPNPQPNPQSMSGDWQGTLAYNNGVTESANLVGLVQDGQNITGAHYLFYNGAPVETKDVTGTITNNSVTITAYYGERGAANFVEMVYTGTVDGNVYNGNVHSTGNTDADGPFDQEGTFSFTRNQNRAAMEEQLESEVDEDQTTEVQSALIEILGIE